MLTNRNSPLVLTAEGKKHNLTLYHLFKRYSAFDLKSNLAKGQAGITLRTVLRLKDVGEPELAVTNSCEAVGEDLAKVVDNTRRVLDNILKEVVMEAG